MIKNSTHQLFFYTVYCVLSVFGIIGSLGYFSGKFNGNFYVYYTNLSNYICMGTTFAALVMTYKKALKKEDGYTTLRPMFKFACMIMILVTFLVYNILLAKDLTAAEYFLSPNNLIMHLILPLMYIADWVLFYEHGKTKWYYPLVSVIMPLIYVIFIFIRAAIIGKGTGALLYPYFFLNAEKLGAGGVSLWIFILILVFVALGYAFYAGDHFRRIKEYFKKSETEQ